MTLEWTGERFLPWLREHSTIAYEHLHRYAFAATLVSGKRVLDLACGEGYGSNMLAAVASAVVGIDIDENAIRHASDKYRTANLQFLNGSIEAIPIKDDHSFDAIICFEAIEHIENHGALLGEVQRLLKEGGVFIVSTPNKAIYHDESPEENPFHVRELYFDEFKALLAGHFGSIQFLGQRIHPSSSIWPIGTANSTGFREFVLDRDSDSNFAFINSAQRIPLYYIAVASNASTQPLPTSTLVDQSDSLIKEKDKTARWLEEQVEDRNKTIDSLERAVTWHQEQISELSKGLEWTKNRNAEMEKTILSNNEALAWRSKQVSELESAKETLINHLQNTQWQLGVAANTLEGIYASRGWKFLTKIRKFRDMLTGRAKPRG
jgi:2-polyprenyl-3-methyl-5-hydroxy-6-metoxy-1,4-benzoquinol methylase